MRTRGKGQVLPFTLSEVFTLLFFALALVLVYEVYRARERERESKETEEIKDALIPLGSEGTKTLVDIMKGAQDSIPNDWQELVRTVQRASDERQRLQQELRRLMPGSTWADTASDAQLLDSLIASCDRASVAGESLAEAMGLPESERNVLDSLAGMVSILRRESRNVRGQLEYLRERCGLDHPPCWADRNGRPEYAYEVEMMTGAVSVLPIWPTDRSADADTIPGMLDLPGVRLPYPEFIRRAIPVFEWSTRQTPECRHFVVIVDHVEGGKEAFKEALLTVERFFYKLLSN
jgi:hypothetical protein